MSVVVIGINHRTSPLGILERVTIAPEDLPKALHGVVARDDVREAVVLSTCNRTEVYAVAERYHAAYADIRDFFCAQSGLGPDEVQPHLYSQHDEAAVAHLFSVAAGLDSAVVGENEILGQVKQAWEKAHSEGTSRSSLNLLFRHAIEVGKRARTETGISRSTTSVSHSAVEMAEEILGSLRGRRVLIVGAGDVAEGVATALARAGAEMTVMNRTEERARGLAEKVAVPAGDSVKVAPLGLLSVELGRADVAVTCTGSGEHLVSAGLLAEARSASDGPILVVDIALPRDVDPAAAEVPGVTLRDLHDLGAWAAKGMDSRRLEAGKVESIVAEEVDRWVLEHAARQTAPLLTQLRDTAEAVRAAELERFAKRLDALGPEEREVVESITRGIVAKLMHGPTVALKDAAGSPQGERLASAVRDLFGLH